MTKIINISKDKLCLIQKVLMLTSIIASAGILALILYGTIPFGGYNTTPFGIMSLFLNIIDIGRRAFIHIVCNVGFSVLYVFVCIKSFFKIIKMIKNRQTWLFSKLDSNPVRAAVSFRVEGFNEIAWYYILLTLVSVIVNGCNFGPLFITILVAIFLVAAIINVVRFICVKRNIEESIVVPLSMILVVVGVLVFSVFVCRTTLPSLWIGIGRFMTILSTENLAGIFIFDAFLKTIVVPIVQFIILYVLLRCASDAFISYVDISSGAKKLAIFSSMCVGAILLSNGFVNEYRDPEQYLQMLLVDGMMMFIPWFLFTISKCTLIVAPDCRLYDPAPGEKGLGDTDAPTKEEPATPTETITAEADDAAIAEHTKNTTPEITIDPTASELTSNTEEQEMTETVDEPIAHNVESC